MATVYAPTQEGRGDRNKSSEIEKSMIYIGRMSTEKNHDATQGEARQDAHTYMHTKKTFPTVACYANSATTTARRQPGPPLLSTFSRHLLFTVRAERFERWRNSSTHNPIKLTPWAEISFVVKLLTGGRSPGSLLRETKQKNRTTGFRHGSLGVGANLQCCNI